MDKDKKELLIGIDVFLWILVFIPGAVYVNELVQHTVFITRKIKGNKEIK